ncbi:MAG: hypothetical protein LBI42_02650 [Chitinispirillales bacterium]|nr:hypothetical protein [Chitinispirillales bacterium]
MSGYTRGAFKRAADEMSALIIPMGSSEDFCLVKPSLPADYSKFLEDSGLVLPKLVKTGERLDSSVTAEPWGWDENAHTTFFKMGVNTFHPDFTTVRKINNRRFCSSFSEIEASGVPNSALLSSPEELKNFFTKSHEYPQIIKPVYGNSGIGFLRLDKPPGETTIAKILNLMKQHGAVAAEPWLKRVMDISSSLDISADGEKSSIRHYRCLVDSRGTFYGVYLPPDSARLEPWIPALDKHVTSCAGYIYKSGYFGPVGFDSFVYSKKDGSEALAPVIEINARHVMSDIARALKSKLANNKYVFYRLLSGKRAALPENYTELRHILRGYLFSPAAGTGILPLTPLRNTTDITCQPYRNAFFISADSKEKLFWLDSFLTNTLRTC